MVGNSEDEHFVGKNPVDQIVWKAAHAQLADTALKLRPNVRVFLQPRDRVLDLHGQVDAKAIHAFFQERRGFGQVVLGFQQQADGDQRWPRRPRTRASASADGTDCVSPAK